MASNLAPEIKELILCLESSSPEEQETFKTLITKNIDIYKYLFLHPEWIIPLASIKPPPVNLLKKLQVYLYQSIKEILQTDHHVKLSFLEQFPGEFKNLDLISLLDRHVWLRGNVNVELELQRTKKILNDVKKYLQVINKADFEEDLDELFKIFKSYHISPLQRYQQLILKLIDIFNKKSEFQALLWQFTHERRFTASANQFNFFRDNKILHTAQMYFGSKKPLPDLADKSYIEEMNVLIISQLTDAMINKHLDDYLKSLKIKESLASKDFQEILTKPYASFLVIEALINRCEKYKTLKDFETLKKLVQLGINKLLYSSELGIDDLQISFKEKFKSFTAPDTPETLIEVAKFLLKNRIPLVKPSQKQDFKKLLAGSLQDNVKHLAMLEHALTKYCYSKYSFTSADEQISEKIKYFSEIYDSLNLSLEQADELLLIPAFLTQQNNNAQTGHLSNLITDFFMVHNYYLTKIIANFAPDEDSQKKLLDLFKFRAKLKLFLILSPNIYYRESIIELLEHTALSDPINYDDIIEGLKKITDNPLLQHLLEHLKCSKFSVELDSGIEKELYQKSQEKLNKQAPEFEKKLTLADFALISDIKLQSENPSVDIKNLCTESPELREKIQKIPIISQTLKDIKNQLYIDKALQYLQTNQVVLPQAPDLLAQLEGIDESELEKKVSIISSSFLFTDQEHLQFLYQIFEIQENEPNISQDINDLIEKLTNSSVFPYEIKQQVIDILAKPANKNLLEKLIETNKYNPILITAKELLNCHLKIEETLKYVQETLAKALEDKKCSTEEIAALIKLQVFFQEEGLEKRIHSLPNFINDNQDSFACLKNNSFLFDLICYLTIILYFIYKHNTPQTVYFEKINQDIKTLNKTLEETDKVRQLKT